MRAKSGLISVWMARKYSEYSEALLVHSTSLLVKNAGNVFKVCNQIKVQKGNLSDQLSWKDFRVWRVTFRG